MKTQIMEIFENIEKEFYRTIENIARLNVHTTENPVFFENYDIWITQHNIKNESIVFEVKILFETLKATVEAMLVK